MAELTHGCRIRTEWGFDYYDICTRRMMVEFNPYGTVTVYFGYEFEKDDGGWLYTEIDLDEFIEFVRQALLALAERIEDQGKAELLRMAAKTLDPVNFM